MMMPKLSPSPTYTKYSVYNNNVVSASEGSLVAVYVTH